MKTPYFIEKIDWSALRTQKSLLLETINNNAISPMHKEGLEGILHLIDAIQDYAVDEMGMSETIVFESETETKETYICPICYSDNVQGKTWIGLNDRIVDDNVEGDDEFCLDCENTITAYPIPLLVTAHVIGFQVVGKEGTDKEGEIHPDMDGSFCIYDLEWCRERINIGDSWELLTIWHGDVEEPTICFEGNPRD